MNLGTSPVEVRCRVDNPEVDGKRQSTDESVRVGPGEQKTLVVPLRRRLPASLAKKLFGMRGYPGGFEEDRGIDTRQVEQLLIFVAKPSGDHEFQVRSVRAAGSSANYALPVSEDKLFPLIDRFGQYVHKDWPGKTHSEEDLKRRLREDEADAAAHRGPADWDQYGGWKGGGPQLEATGFFRAEKYQGKWWLVDPEGRLFWSHGVDCVRAASETTPISDRKHWFEGLPEPSSPLARFYGRGNRAAHGYYQDKSYETYSFSGANLLRKYGEDFERQFGESVHRRLRSWGMNTIGNWSGREVYLLRRTPYVATVNSGRKPIEGSTGYWGKFPDAFDPDFAASLKRNLQAEKETTGSDPWCLGYFVDNELGWGDEYSLAEAALASPAGQAAKNAFLADLKAKYGTIEKLNQAWSTEHASWEALRESRAAPSAQKAAEDLRAFYSRLAEQYFRLCREAVKAVAPKRLYLGCRFAWVNDRAIRAAAKHCDAISFNVYQRSLVALKLPQGVDLPVIIGEFHFGALDRGMFHTGLVKTADQRERAATYRKYLQSGLAHPNVVGTHWFQFRDQATTGRSDGENYQIGLVDICDTPYPETITAVREVGASMYAERLGAK